MRFSEFRNSIISQEPKGKQMSALNIEQPIKGLHPAKTPPNYLGEFLEAVFGFAFMAFLFWGSFALAAWLCANY